MTSTAKEAMFYQKLPCNEVICETCRFGCWIAEGKRGHCQTRENRGGTLYTLTYRRLVAEHADPIEKKPLFHVLPGTKTYSIATPGCNFRCQHCQNHQLAQTDCSDIEQSGCDVAPEEIVKRALNAGCDSISFTYTEVAVYFEYAFEIAMLAKEAGLKNILVTNGYLSKKPLMAIAPFIDAANVDLKGFDPLFYRDVIQADLRLVAEALPLYKELGIWLEVTTVVIPGQNDDALQLTRLANFIAEQLGKETPWHITRFAPHYQLAHLPLTPLASLELAVEAGKRAGLQHVYQLDVSQRAGKTHCPTCDELVIDREGYHATKNLLSGGKCPGCCTAVDGVW